MNQQTGNTGFKGMKALYLLALDRSLASPKVFIGVEHYCETTIGQRQTNPTRIQNKVSTSKFSNNQQRKKERTKG
uniref:Uncharacterized protein n=1 Tax=Cucumis melo TaxID=3656 RepID=A0A9I9EGU8_CUCME